MIRFLIWAMREKWFTGIATPNSVMSGAFVGNISEELKTYSRASHSTKFPGISISMFSGDSTNSCTPEIYLRRGAFIIPGVKSAIDLSECCVELSSIYDNYKTTP